MKGLLALRLSLPAGGATIAEPPAYHIDSWHTDQGLPQSSVTSIVQTRDRYLWLGTFNGLARFDGVRFQTFDPNDSAGLPSGRIIQMFEDQRGALWLGTEEGYLVRKTGDRFDAYIPPNRGTLPKHARTFAEADGALWMSTAEGLLVRFAAGQFSLPATNGALRGATVNSVVTDAAGELWVGTEKELAAWREGNFVTLWDQAREKNFGVDVLSAGRTSGCWVAGNGRLRKFDRGQWVVDRGPYPWTKGDPQCLCEDRCGQVWIGTYGSGVFRCETNGMIVQISRAEGLPGNSVRAVCEDREGNIWVGTEGGGLARLKRTTFRSYGRQQGLSGDCVLTVCEGADGALWIGTNGDGVDRLKNGVVEHFGPRRGLSNEYVWSLCLDGNKTLWAGTWGGGLFKFDGEKFVSVPNTGSTVVCGIFCDSRGEVWLGQQMAEAAIVRLRAGQPEKLKLPSGLSYADVRALTEDRDGSIWIGTYDDGLYRVKNGEVTRFDTRNGLSSDRIRALYADGEGAVWIGTSRGGLNCFRASEFISFTKKDGLADDVILHIAEDRSGNLWCSAGNGIFRVRKSELIPTVGGPRRPIRCFAYDKADGLPSLEISGGCQPAGCTTRDGRLWFPTVNGLAVADPATVPLNSMPPKVVIEQVLIEGVPGDVIPKASGACHAASYSVSRTPHAALLKVPPGKRRFEFHYTALSFTAPEKVRFKFKLENLEQDWVEVGQRRVAIYSYLEPGDYRFRVAACNNDGVWNETGATLALTVLPHVWQTWWFRLLLALGVGLVLVGGYEIRLASERRLTRLRLHLARDLHDEVGSNVGSIALLSEVMSKHANGLEEEVTEIRRIAVQTVDSLRDIVWFLDPAGDKLGDLIPRMKDTAHAMLPNIPFTFRSIGATGSVAPSLELRRNFFPMFKEILHNAAKHAHARRVKIVVKVEPQQFQLRINDDGIGFDEAHVRTGNGLKNLRRRAAELGGKLNIASQPGRGTTVTLAAPITQTRELRGTLRRVGWHGVLPTRRKRNGHERKNR